MVWNTAWSYVPINYNITIGTIENMTKNRERNERNETER